MFLYIHWKFDFGEEKKVKVLYIGVEKQTPKTKYVVSRGKYCLATKELNDNLNEDTIYYSRVRVGNLKTTTLYWTVLEYFNQDNNYRTIKIYINCNPNTSAVIIKKEIKSKLTNLFLNPYDLEDELDEYIRYDGNKIHKIITKIIKEIKTNGRLIHIDSHGSPVEFRFITETYPQLLNFIRIEDVDSDEESDSD